MVTFSLLPNPRRPLAKCVSRKPVLLQLIHLVQEEKRKPREVSTARGKEGWRMGNFEQSHQPNDQK